MYCSFTCPILPECSSDIPPLDTPAPISPLVSLQTAPTVSSLLCSKKYNIIAHTHITLIFIMKNRYKAQLDYLISRKLHTCIEYCIWNIFRRYLISQISRFRKNYTQRTKNLYGPHLIFDQFAKFYPCKNNMVFHRIKCAQLILFYWPISI